MINWVHQVFQETLQATWDSHRSTFLKHCKPSIEKWVDREDRREQRVLTRCRIGHTRLTKEHLYNRNVSKNCDTCQTELTVEHILINCIKYDNLRDELEISSNIQVALGNNKSEETKVLKFLKKCNLYDKL